MFFYKEHIYFTALVFIIWHAVHFLYFDTYNSMYNVLIAALYELDIHIYRYIYI